MYKLDYEIIFSIYLIANLNGKHKPIKKPSQINKTQL